MPNVLPEPDRLTGRRAVTCSRKALRCEAVEITREQCCPPDVVSLDQSCGPSFQSEGKAAVWRHAVAESLQIRLIQLGRFTAVGESPLIVHVLVQPLTAGDELKTAEIRSNEFVQRGLSGCGWV
jgi:hypothetical protein